MRAAAELLRPNTVALCYCRRCMRSVCSRSCAGRRKKWKKYLPT